MMRTIRIHDLAAGRDILAFDLRDILSALGPQADRTIWRVSKVKGEFMVTGDDAADKLENLAESETPVSGRRLRKISRHVVQTIMGEFRGYKNESSADPWIIVIAYDSTWFEVPVPKTKRHWIGLRPHSKMYGWFRAGIDRDEKTMRCDFNVSEKIAKELINSGRRHDAIKVYLFQAASPDDQPRSWPAGSGRKPRSEFSDRLLSSAFAGRNELAIQADSASVSRIDREGSLQFRTIGPSAAVSQRVPVEGRYLDGSDDPSGPAVNLSLHVVDGRLHELEVYKDDGSDIVVGPFESFSRANRGSGRKFSWTL